MFRYAASTAVLACAVLCAWPALAQEPDVSGRYAVQGSNPGDAGQYSGEVEVVRTGETYQVNWRIGSEGYLGTGIVRDGSFAVVYRPQSEAAGIAHYRILPNGSLKGSWVGFGGKALGSEIWNPRDRL